MDDLLREFLTETNESLDVVDVELVKFEQDPNNAKILDNIFRLVHTIKGTCGFLGLPRLEALAHAGETLMGRFRDGVPVTGAAVTVILSSIDRIKAILGELDRTGEEPAGDDQDLIGVLEEMSLASGAKGHKQPDPEPEPAKAVGEIAFQELERELRPGEVSLDDLERAFRETEVEAPVVVVEKAEAKASPARPSASDAEPKAEVAGNNATIRVSVDTLETMMTMVSELVLTRNQLLEIVRHHEDSEFKVPLQRLSNVTAELQEGVMKTRMQPIGNAWQKLPRIVRDLSAELDKPIDLEMIGAETELDRQVLDFIKDPLTHMVRNSADHGLESPVERLAVGKPERGHIKLSAYHEGGQILIEISDDGRGLNLAKIKKKALESGITTEAELEKLSEQQIYKFIFAPGFSTAAAITSVSGRGVGMDVVRNNIELIGGTIDLKTVAGEGTTFTIKIPLTLAIVPALIVEASGDRYAIPQLAVVELVRVQANSEHRIEHIKNTPVLRLRNKLLPLVHLSKLLGLNDAPDMSGKTGFIVVTQIGGLNFGIVVDGVFHTEEIVVKPMASRLRHINMFSGTTILGDGSVILIIDPNGVAGAVGSNVDLARDDSAERQAAAAVSNAMTSLLLFRAGGSAPKAVPLSLITRLEEIDVTSIERTSGRSMVQYRGKLMQLVSVSYDAPQRTEGMQPLLVFSEGERSIGLLVDEIVDIVEDRMDIDVASESQGVVGTSIIKGKATEIIDVTYYLTQVFEDWLHRKEQDVGNTGRKQLLFVDDSAFFRNMLTPVLKAAGFEVVAAESASNGLELVKSGQRFDIIVSDIEMPDMDGFAFAETLRNTDEARDTPIIALSSLISPAALEKGRAAGFHDYVAKFDRPGLLAVLKDKTTDMRNVA
jgi:two-component system chemotaxis sensor kinase CheA